MIMMRQRRLMILQQLIRCWSIPQFNPNVPIHRPFVLHLINTV